jgi:hypothetical protein
MRKTAMTMATTMKMMTAMMTPAIAPSFSPAEKKKHYQHAEPNYFQNIKKLSLMDKLS